MIAPPFNPVACVCSVRELFVVTGATYEEALWVLARLARAFIAELPDGEQAAATADVKAVLDAPDLEPQVLQ